MENYKLVFATFTFVPSFACLPIYSPEKMNIKSSLEKWQHILNTSIDIFALLLTTTYSLR